MALSCLTDYIGVEGCSGSTPPSGLYINQLPGVNLKMIQYIADDDQETFTGVWDDVQARAIRKFENDVRALFAKRYQLKSLTHSFDTGKEIDTSDTTAAGAQYRGYIFELNDNDDDFTCSNLQMIYLQTVYVYATDQQDITVVVYDLDTGSQLDTSTLASASVTANAWNTINLYGQYAARRVFIGVDYSLMDSVKLDTSELDDAVDCSDCCEMELEGAVAATGQSSYVDSDLTLGNNAHGVSIRISVKCSFESLICRNLKTFETAFWYLLGAELMTERLFTDRLNEYTIFDRNKAKDLRTLFMVYYQGGEIDGIEYKGELVQAVDGINLMKNDFCLECSGQVNFRNGVNV